MPGNTVQINGSKELEWYVGDTLIDFLFEWLDENAIKAENTVVGMPLTKIQMLDNWISDLVFPGKVSHFVQVIKSFKDKEQEVKEFCIYTNEYKYRIYAVDRKKDDGYIGCGVVTRKMRPGEDWIRGNDLRDGPFVKETWDRILKSIVTYELVMLSKHTKPNTIPQDVA
jgi:hypothetical protein